MSSASFLSSVRLSAAAAYEQLELAAPYPVANANLLNTVVSEPFARAPFEATA